MDRLVLEPKSDNDDPIRRRVSQSIETALKMSEGSVLVVEVKDNSVDFPAYPKQLEDHLFSERFACPVDNIALSEIEPRMFSFNSPHGACSECTGLGTVMEIDAKTVLNPILSIAEGGILPWQKFATQETWFTRLLEAVGKKFGFDLNTRIENMSEQAKRVLLVS